MVYREPDIGGLYTEIPLHEDKTIHVKMEALEKNQSTNRMKKKWPLYLIMFMRHEDINSTTKISHFDIPSIAVAEAKAANL